MGEEKINWEDMTAEQQQQLIAFFTELQFFDRDVWKAIVQMEPMTQAMFDYIQLRRMEVGPGLEDIAGAVFLAYPEFAMNYAERMEKAVCGQKTDAKDMTSETDDCYERIRRKISAAFGYDIGETDAIHTKIQR